MPQFILAYHHHDAAAAPTPDPETQKAQMGRWMAWVKGLGEAMLNPGTPLGPSNYVSAQGVETSAPWRLTGYSIVSAGSMDEALGMARSCPFAEMGTIQVSELREMKM